MCELVEAHFNEYYLPAKPCPITVFIIPCNLTIANTSIAARPPAANLPSIFSLFFCAAPLGQLLPKNASKRLIRHAKHDCLPKIEEIAQGCNGKIMCRIFAFNQKSGKALPDSCLYRIIRQKFVVPLPNFFTFIKIRQHSVSALPDSLENRKIRQDLAIQP